MTLSLATLLSPSALTRYMGWASRTEIFDAMELWTAPSRRVVRSRLTWLVDSGRAERRGEGNHAEFRLCASAFGPHLPRCARCPKPPVAGKTQCQYHLDYDAKFRRDRYAARRQS